ncbi:M14 family metallopeptidase [Paenibacillus lignilyticus]|uniref:LysM peptidoglycan-binding domain-containing protein n=1 Tax=Paenibacillus lignilyticus TaxID=1172615 RepID=A0ABS5C641_9BACL|nr:M14 family metallopeptidase [Paenibacillus lignilyticus]MBP3961464.1 LysM peptidoglycan-binding domain-containing protein [Paenibacillus lignilyticus]
MLHPYVVQTGDTLLRIARSYGINPEALLAANPRVLASERLTPGLLLAVPAQPTFTYRVNAGDTLLRIAALFAVSTHALIAVNSHIDLTFLQQGQLICIPVGDSDRIVNGRAEYGARELETDIEQLRNSYPFLLRRRIGQSVMGKPITAISLGEGASKVHINAGMHANEWITTPLLMTFAEDMARAAASGTRICGADIRSLLRLVTLWLVPLVNPDGAELVQEGMSEEHPYYHELLDWNRGSTRFSKWKANIRGVDLNDQFPAFWEVEAERRDAAGPGPRDYPGPQPLSEPEAQALAAFTEEEQFDLVVALHTQGQEIYWNYRGYEPPAAELIAAKLAKASGYKSVKLTGSDAGYKDWFIQDYRKPGFTVEVGYGVNPLPLSSFHDLYDELKPLLITAMEAAVPDML